MKKLISILAVVACLASVAGICLAGNSGVTNEVGPFTQSSGKFLKDKIQSTLDNVVAALDKAAVETGSATNAQAVVFTGTYTVAPIVLIETQNATTNSYASSVTTAGFTANMAAGDTNKFVVISVQ